MKDLLTDANFPRTADQRVYHLGIRAGEVANRIVTVGSPYRAESIAAHLDEPDTLLRLTSERAFLTITGRYKGVPVSIVSIGMGYPNVDFFVREARECLTGDMVVIRLGSCGGLVGLTVGSLVVPKACVAVSRNVDFDFNSDAASASVSGESPYRISKPVAADPGLYATISDVLSASPLPLPGTELRPDVVNASTDSFYSSQGRQTSFPDHNEGLIQQLVSSVPDVASLEMETFHLYHLASVWRPPSGPSVFHDTNTSTVGAQTAPPADLPVPLSISAHPPPHAQAPPAPSARASRIRAAAVQMVFAARTSTPAQAQSFIAPPQVAALEAWAGRAVLDALVAFAIPPELLHEERGSVWERK